MPLDIPGSCMVPKGIGFFGTSSTGFLLKAADPYPRSSVCLKKEGSFEPSDCIMSLLEAVALLTVAGSATVRGDLAALFSVATIDNGRLLPVAESRDEGRCCHDSVLERIGSVAALADFNGFSGGFGGEAAISVFAGYISRLGGVGISSDARELS